MAHSFSVPAADMLQEARTMQAIFIQDKTTFKDFDGSFDDPFADDWLTSIDTADAAETAETRLDEQKLETAGVLDTMAQARQIYNLCKYFIEKAFADKKELQDKFGLNNYDTDGYDQRKMSNFLSNLYSMCQNADYKPALLTAGLTQTQIDNIGTLRDKFNEFNTKQNTFIKQTAQATAERDALYNDAYSFMQRVNRASKVLFAGNEVKLNQYALPHGSPGEIFNVEGKVTDATNNGQELKGVLVEIKELDLSTLTNFYGNYGFVDVPAGSYTLQFTLAGYGPKTVPFTMVANGKLVSNQSLSVI